MQSRGRVCGLALPFANYRGFFRGEGLRLKIQDVGPNLGLAFGDFRFRFCGFRVEA